MLAHNACNILFSNELYYNKIYLSERLLTYLLVRLRINLETQSKRLKNRIFRKESDSFWRLVSITKIFPENQSPLPSESSSSPTQWRLSISHRLASLSQSDDAATVPFAHGPVVAEPIKKTSRPNAVDDDLQTQRPPENHFRPRLYGSAAVWKTGNGDHRIQSGQKRPAVVSSLALFQRHHQGLLAGGTPSWRHAHGYIWGNVTFAGIPSHTVRSRDFAIFYRGTVTWFWLLTDFFPLATLPERPGTYSGGGES